MFKPNFKYTNKIVNNLIKISVARELIMNFPFIPKWEITLRREAIIKNTHSSTAIEGNKLSLEQVSELLHGREVMASRKDRQEVLNYLNVLEKLGELTENDNITEKNILSIHKMITSKTLENDIDCGRYRDRYVVVGNRFTNEISFKPPQNSEVPDLIKDLIEWFNSETVKELDPVIEAGIAHYELVRIHPFIDGNGRTARVLAALILYQRGFDTKQFFCLDDYYDSDRSAYYKALQSVNQKTLDLTSWLEYFTDGVTISMDAVRQRIIRLSSERLIKSKRGQIALTERQMKIIEFINQNGNIANKNVREMFKISDRAALKELRKLTDMKVIKPDGEGRNLSYILLRT
jgi:Fic family protein